MITLRPYQTAARDAARSHWQANNRAALIVLPTGTGKTEVILATLEAELYAGTLRRAVILAHRQELIYQPRDRAAKNWPNLPPLGVVMADENEADAKIIVATIQTLSANGRLANILRHGPITHLVIDEAHHTTASTYRAMIETLTAANPNLRILGVTATPKRTDKEGLAAIYGKQPVYRLTLKEAIKAGALCPFRAIGVELPVSAKSVRIIGSNGDSDYDQEEMGAVMDAANARELIVETWRREASDRPTMIFTSSVDQAHHLAADFRRAGYAFQAVDGETPKAERQRIIEDYQAGRLHGIINCQVFTEGFDAPHTSCIGMAKPTRSDLVYLQCAGRGLRTHPAKTDLLLLDFAPQDARDMVMAGDLIGKPKAEKKAEDQAEKKGVILGCFALDREGNGIDGDPDDVKMRLLDLLSSSPLRWTYGENVATVPLSLEHMAAVVMPQPARVQAAQTMKQQGKWKPEWDAMFDRLGNYQAVGLEKSNGGFRLLDLGVCADWDSAQDVVEMWAHKVAVDLFSRKDRRWRSAEPKPGQVRMASQLRLDIKGMNRGQVSQAIGHALALRELRKHKLLA